MNALDRLEGLVNGAFNAKSAGDLELFAAYVAKARGAREGLAWALAGFDDQIKRLEAEVKAKGAP